MTSFLLAYDADCGSCTRFRHAVEFFDLRNRVGFISLVDADDSGLLDSVPESSRHTSFHLILPDGRVLSGTEALPRLFEILPAGVSIRRAVTVMPGGLRLISHLYTTFSRAHDGSACSYRTPGRREPYSPRKTELRILNVDRKHSVSTYVLAGALGGLVGCFVMGLFVGLPDALCIALATFLAGSGTTSYDLAWAFHILTGVVIGTLFGVVAGAIQLGSRKPVSRCLVAGLTTGLLVWSGFFLPLMLHFFPGLVTSRLVDASFAAHVALGSVLGVALSLGLIVSQGDSGITGPESPAPSS